MARILWNSDPTLALTGRQRGTNHTLTQGAAWVAAAPLALAIWFAASPVQASSALVVHAAEGSATCSQIFVNSILSVPASVATGTYGAPPQSITVTLNAAKTVITSWSLMNVSAQPINGVIIKGGGGKGLVYHFGPVGTRQDTEVAGPTGGAIQSIKFCYGLSGPTTATPVRACTLTADEISCTPSSDSFVNYRVILGDNVGDRAQYEVCQCNVSQFKECDPNGEPGAAGSCIEDDTLFELPSLTEFGNTGTYFCTTISGRRTCYSRTIQ